MSEGSSEGFKVEHNVAQADSIAEQKDQAETAPTAVYLEKPNNQASGPGTVILLPGPVDADSSSNTESAGASNPSASSEISDAAPELGGAAPAAASENAGNGQVDLGFEPAPEAESAAAPEKLVEDSTSDDRADDVDQEPGVDADAKASADVHEDDEFLDEPPPEDDQGADEVEENQAGDAPDDDDGNDEENDEGGDDDGEGGDDDGSDDGEGDDGDDQGDAPAEEDEDDTGDAENEKPDLNAGYQEEDESEDAEFSPPESRSELVESQPAPSVAATAGSTPLAPLHYRLLLVELNTIEDDLSFQLRPEGEIDSLATSVACLGQVFPVDLRQLPSGRLQLITGFRRISALRLLKREKVLARVHSQLSDEDALRMALADLLENRGADRDQLVTLRERLQGEHRLTAAVRETLDKVITPDGETLGPEMVEGAEDEVDLDELGQDLAGRLAAINQDLSLIVELWNLMDPALRDTLLEQLGYPEQLVSYLRSINR